MKPLLISLACIVISYLAFAFIMADFDFQNWKTSGRILYVMATMFSILACARDHR